VGIVLVTLIPSLQGVPFSHDIILNSYTLDSASKNVFSKVDPLLIVSLIFDRNANENHIYTLEVILKPGHDTKAIRQEVVDKTGIIPSLYLSGTNGSKPYTQFGILEVD